MNTGKALQTERLLLLPGLNARDNKPFLRMLREDGDFYMFCGVKYSRWRLRRFANYFERTGHGECMPSCSAKPFRVSSSSPAMSALSKRMASASRVG